MALRLGRGSNKNLTPVKRKECKAGVITALNLIEEITGQLDTSESHPALLSYKQAISPFIKHNVIPLWIYTQLTNSAVHFSLSGQ